MPPGILLKTHKTSHLQYTSSFLFQSCLTAVDNGIDVSCRYIEICECGFVFIPCGIDYFREVPTTPYSKTMIS